MTEQNRSAGVLLHITSLPSAYGCGSLGEEAKKFIDYLRSAGFRYWQILPFNVPDEVASPYSAESSYLGNPLCIDLETLKRDGLISAAELSRQAVPGNGNRYKLRELRAVRMAFLRSVWARLEKSADEAAEKLKAEIAAYLSANEDVAKSCAFFALKNLNGNADWQQWEISERDLQEDAEQNAAYRSDVAFYAFLAYEFEKQWAEIKAYANSNFVRIIGDVPIYVNLQSADVYYNRESFQLDEAGYPTHVSGIPAGKGEKGQKWCHPLYNVPYLRRENYRFVVHRFAHYLNQFDLIRIDHFKAFSAYGSIPAGGSAEEGVWVEDSLGEECLQSILDAVGQNRLIAEDVGAEEDRNIQEWLRTYRIPGMKIVQFDADIDRYGDSIAYTGTHDNDTMLGYLNRLDETACKEIAGRNHIDYTDRKRLAVRLMEKLFASRARIVILPVQDLLLQDTSARMNTPGMVEDTTWMYALTGTDLERLKENAEQVKKLLAESTHNRIRILQNEKVSVQDYFGEVIVTYHRKDEARCKPLFDRLEENGCRYYKNAIDEVTIRNSEYEDRLDERLSRCSRLILVFSNSLFANATIMRLVWYQVGHVLPKGTGRVLTFCLDKPRRDVLTGSPIGTLNLESVDKFDVNTITSDHVVASTVCEKYFEDASVNDYAVQKINYRRISLQAEITAEEFRTAAEGENSIYAESPQELLQGVDVGCYLLRFSFEGINVRNVNYADEMQVDYHTDYLTDNGVISKRCYKISAKEGEKYCFVFDFLVPVHHPLGSVVKPYFVWKKGEKSFRYFQKLLYTALPPYEILQRDLVVEESSQRIYFSLDFALHEITKELTPEEQKQWKLGKVVDLFYPQ
mgnify:CR=1 FL=1